MEAINFYEKALALSTESLSSYAGLAYTYHLQVLIFYAFNFYVTDAFTILPVSLLVYRFS